MLAMTVEMAPMMSHVAKLLLNLSQACFWTACSQVSVMPPVKSMPWLSPDNACWIRRPHNILHTEICKIPSAVLNWSSVLVPLIFGILKLPMLANGKNLSKSNGNASIFASKETFGVFSMGHLLEVGSFVKTKKPNKHFPILISDLLLICMQFVPVSFTSSSHAIATLQEYKKFYPLFHKKFLH
ncbi:hypothetical protein T10_4724 [Trichinella papuae]|uniref:Uncharacterized protein n=1 Tax=Trichinella papuae TaxID=268474 RepID=A0A0V1MBC4_9BILA|nr:hypothetical protein T10_4724 [Trichinella papuae]